MLNKLSESQIIFNANGAVGKRISSNEKTEFVHLTLEENSVIETHSLDFDIEFFILKGRGKVLLNEETLLVEKDDLLHVAPGINRKWENIGNTALEVLVIKHLE